MASSISPDTTIVATPRPTGVVRGTGTAASPTAGPAEALVMLANPRSPAAEAYRTLRINIQFARVDEPVRLLALTSAGAGEGKSTTLANLAIAMAESGQRVIAVDADLRRPGLHTLFGLPNEDGLTTALLAEDAPLPLQRTSVPGLQLLASGPLPPNPAELLGSRRMERVFTLLRDQADVVLFDTPPAAGVADAATLARRLDGVVLVVGAGRTKRELAKRARDLLQRVNANILGVVLTGARIDPAVYSY